MSFSTLDENDNDEQGIDPLVLSLEEFSRAQDELATATDVLGSNEPQLTGWIVHRAALNENKPSCRRSAPALKDSKEVRSSTPRRSVSRQFARNRGDLGEFKYFLQPSRYIEQYRNEKINRQEAALRELASKNDRRRASDSYVDLGKNGDHTENGTFKNVPSVVSMKEVQTAEDDNTVKPLVVSSKGLSRPANLPMSGQFHGRKLQWRPTVGNRKITNAKVSQWSQAHIDVTLEITSHGNGDVSHLVHSSQQSEGYTPFQERRSSANLVVKRGELGGAATTNHRSDSKSQPQTIGVQCSPIEKCDAWVKNRDNDLGNISGNGKEQLTAKARGIRGLHTACGHSSQLSLRGSSLNSPQKDSCSARAAESSKCATGMDYSKYTDMFKNVLEFYGTRRLRPKSHSAVEQLLSMKT
ncbi:uncharacterized protein LOC110066338 [Orbicella faveolata]|uniref:uncharacterized protein LOC110066338 n=1 Tax=Orbicella faveolata TaxID=48498 RepID=UPI0009E214A7|nr:uncharacterized protein LOC110066338 [Orbicella faveolata]